MTPHLRTISTLSSYHFAYSGESSGEGFFKQQDHSLHCALAFSSFDICTIFYWIGGTPGDLEIQKGLLKYILSSSDSVRFDHECGN